MPGVDDDFLFGPLGLPVATFTLASKLIAKQIPEELNLQMKQT